jgi:CubicO group peptidase (beta-lactamase class C family)
MPTQLQMGISRRTAVALGASGFVLSGGPNLHAAEPDVDILGAARGYPVGPNATEWWQLPYRVGSSSDLAKVPGLRFNHVPKPPTTLTLPRANLPPALAYRYEGKSLSISDYLDRQRCTGLLVLRRGEIVEERYRYARKDTDRLLSFSMGKSLTALLLGIAHHKGLIRSLDHTAQTYATAFAGSAYGATNIRDLLRMSSGLRFTELYDGKDDLARMHRASMGGSSSTVVDVLRAISVRDSPAGTVFHYNSAETEVLGRVVTAATGRSLAALTSEWLWEPIGAEASAYWRASPDGQDAGYGYFSAVLRDWGRLGALLANDGRVGPRQVLPLDFLLEATDAKRQPKYLQPRVATPYAGYGYQFWLLPFRVRTFALLGVYGQALFVQPETQIAMVVTSVWEKSSAKQDPQPTEERDALWRGVLSSLGGVSS